MARKGKLKPDRFREAPEMSRPIRLKRYKYLFLIGCEYKKTEPIYFDRFKKLFPEKTLYLKPFGTGKQSLGVI